jgi:hypothetical protein
VYTELSTRRVLVTEYVLGDRFEVVRRADELTRDRYAEIVFRFFFGLLYRDLIALGDPHPGNYLLRPDGRVCFLDYGLLRTITRERATAESAVARSVRERDPAGLKAALILGGYLPQGRAERVTPELLMGIIRGATSWYAVPGEHRFVKADERDQSPGGADFDPRRAAPDQRAAVKQQVNQLTLPPESALIGRMHGLVESVLEALGAGANWGGIAAEYLHGEPPVTALGQAEAEFLAARASR